MKQENLPQFKEKHSTVAAIRKRLLRLGQILIPNLKHLQSLSTTVDDSSSVSARAKLNSPCVFLDSEIDDYSYISKGGHFANTKIGKFCSIGPNALCGWGIHPTNGISTSPMFYSTKKQNGFSLCEHDKIEETKTITIGHDVFIGANVTILDGVSIGTGAVIGAGSIVSKSVPPYAIAFGSPIKIHSYRFEENQREQLLQSEWWNWDLDDLKKLEQHFTDPFETIQEIQKKRQNADA